MNLVFEGFSFMLLGMGSVFLFLIIMVLVLKVQGLILDKIFKENLEVIATPKAENSNDKEIVAVIAAAINQFKTKS